MQIAVNRKLFVSRGALATAIAAMLLAGCLTSVPDKNFPTIVGASSKSDTLPCADYASYTSYSGNPYTAGGSSRHKGMDFCTNAGEEVIAAANGTIVNISWSNPDRGGRVGIKTNILYFDPMSERELSLFLDALHITPKEGLNVGDNVKAGQVIGHTEPPGKEEIGPRSHVHFTAGPFYQTWALHTDPNRFWKKGPGIVSCFDLNSPPSDKEVVAPIKC